jgi:hypothetical protein
MGHRRPPDRENARHRRGPSGHLPVVVIALTSLLVIAVLALYFAI